MNENTWYDVDNDPDFGRPPRKRYRRIIPFLLVLILLAGIAVGGAFLVKRHNEEVAAQKAKAAALAKKAAAEKRARDAERARKKAIATCITNAGAFISDLRGIDAQLSGAGLSFQTYSNEVAKASHDDASIYSAGLSQTCQDAIADGEQALSYYGDVVNAWSDCITSDYTTSCEAYSDFDASGWDDATPLVTSAWEKLHGDSSTGDV